MRRAAPPGGRRADPTPPPEGDDAALFREEMRGVRPARPSNRIEPWRPEVRPHPAQRIADERAVLDELVHLALDGDEAEIEDDGAFLRPGLPRDILRKLRRAHWVIQEDLDLHGLTGAEAAARTAAFLAGARRHGLRCVRIVHGKGLRSRGREPVLKRVVRRLLTRRDEVLAFVEPRAIHGGGGAVVVLLDA